MKNVIPIHFAYAYCLCEKIKRGYEAAQWSGLIPAAVHPGEHRQLPSCLERTISAPPLMHFSENRRNFGQVIRPLEFVRRIIKNWMCRKNLILSTKIERTIYCSPHPASPLQWRSREVPVGTEPNSSRFLYEKLTLNVNLWSILNLIQHNSVLAIQAMNRYFREQFTVPPSQSGENPRMTGGCWQLDQVSQSKRTLILIYSSWESRGLNRHRFSLFFWGTSPD